MRVGERRTPDLPPRIYHPVFVDGGRALLCTGDSERLSLYCTATGSTLSRGALGYAPPRRPSPAC